MNIDLNLMQIFHAVHKERSVSRAAVRLGLSQPAVSHALGRLRAELGDPLFVRMPGGVAPTAKAERLAVGVAQALRTLEMAIQETSSFDPTTSDRTFCLYMTDISEWAFMPKLVDMLRSEAPRLKLEVYQLALDRVQPALETGEVDLAVGDLPKLIGVRSHVLFSEPYVVLMRAGHPALAEGAGPAVLSQLEYVVRSHSQTQRQLEALQLQDRVRVRMSHFLSLPDILLRSDLVTIVPQGIIGLLAAADRFAFLPLPGYARQLDVAIHWCWRLEGDPGHRWFRERLIQLLSRSPD